MVSTDDSEDDRRDEWFQPYRVPLTPAGEALVAHVTASVEAAEVRKRGRKEADQITFEAAVRALVSELAHQYLKGDTRRLVISRSKRALGRRDRYRPDFLGETLPALLDFMASDRLKWVDQELGQQGYGGKPGQATTIYAGDALQEAIDREGLERADFGLGGSPETIILKSTKADYWDEAELIGYDDTPETEALRAEMTRINAAIGPADIRLDWPAGEPKAPDTSRRFLRRTFTHGSFANGGRLFGGYWMDMKPAHRIERLTIGGEPVASVDFGQFAPRVLYGMAGVTPPVGDLYVIPGLEGHREGVKKALNAMIFAPKPVKRKPRGMKAILPDLPMEGLSELITTAHPALAPFFGQGIGHQVQRVESDILVRVLLDLQDQGAVALPIHDAILVPRRWRKEAAEVMLRAFRDRVGGDGIVAISPDK